MALRELVDADDQDATVSAISRWRRRHKHAVVIVDQFAREPGVVPPGRPQAWGFLGSLEDPDFSFATSEEVRETLVRTGYRLQDETELPGHWHLIDAALPGG